MIDPSTPLRGLPVAVIDFEGTGYAGPDAHVVEVAVVHATFGNDAVSVAFASKVKPPVPIPAEVVRLHGIDDAAVADAPRWADVADAVEAACAGRLVVAFCAPADYTFQATEQGRIGRAPIAWPWLDLLVVRRATKTRGRPGKLLEIAAEHGIALDAHGATGDALATALLLRPMMRAAWSAGAFRGPSGAQPRRWRDHDEEDEDEAPARVETVGQLLGWQRGAALWQESDFADYCRRRGDVSPPRCDWHALEGVEAPSWGPPVRTTPCARCGAPTVVKIGQDGGRSTTAPDGTVHACP